MNKAQKLMAGFLVVAIVAMALLMAVSMSITGRAIVNPDSNSTILYYSLSCPHCKIVEDFIGKNNITSRINMMQKEVSASEADAKELIAVGRYCKLEDEGIGAVPLLYAEGKCYLGDVEIISFFKSKLNITI